MRDMYGIEDDVDEKHFFSKEMIQELNFELEL